MPAQPTPGPNRPPRAARLVAALAVLAAMLVAAPAASGAPANYKGSSADGEVVFFETGDQLVAGDTDTKIDVYERYYEPEAGIESYVTRIVSLGPAGGNDAYNATFEKASEDGSKVFFSTDESLVEADTDRRADVYMRDLEAGETVLVSVGEEGCAPACGNAEIDSRFGRASADGGVVFFVTDESLDAGDTDSAADVYARDLAAETTSQVSVGGNGEFDAALRGLSADGSWAYFTTAEKLLPGDTDSVVDIYARDVAGATTVRVSQGEAGGNGTSVPVFQAASEAGTRVFFTSDEALAGADTDAATDIYARDLPGGPTTLVSDGSSSADTASFAAASADGQHVFFSTKESLLGEDGDNANDVYEWTQGGGIALVTSAACVSACGATFDAASEDSSTVVFSTAEKLDGADTDSRVDIYEQEVGGGSPVLVSRGGTTCPGCGNGDADARFNRASADASRVVFTTSEVLTADDLDEEDDIYGRDISTPETSLVTTAPSYCPQKKGNCGATFVGASADGTHVFFTTVERFTLQDGDNEVDVYERFLGSSPSEEVTRLVSTGNFPDLELGPAAPLLQATNPPSPDPSTAPKILGEAEAGTAVKIYASADCSGEPVATGQASQLLAPGIATTVAAGSVTKFRATAEAEGFISPCSAALTYESEIAAPPSGGGGGDVGGSSGSSGGSGSAGGGSGGAGIVYLVPNTRITFAPAAKTRARHPAFRFTDSTGQPGTTFRCRLDRRRWKHCHSPLRLKKVKRGRHVLRVKAVNAIGESERKPARRKFKLVRR